MKSRSEVELEDNVQIINLFVSTFLFDNDNLYSVVFTQPFAMMRIYVLRDLKA